MNRITAKLIFCFGVLTLIVTLTCQKKEITTIKILGSTTTEPIMKKITDEFSKTRNVSFSINAVGSKNGIDSLIAGVCDIAMSSMEILPEQTIRAKQKGISIKPFLLGYDIIVPVVHPSNSVSDITINNLKAVFERKISQWSALGGVDTAIDAVDHLDISGTYEVWHRYVALSTDFKNQQRPAFSTNSSVLAYVSEHTNAIGYVSNAYINPDVKPLKLNGISVVENDSLLSEYHLKRPLYLYINEEKFTEDVKLLIIYLITNNRVKEIFRQSGFFYDL